MTSNVDFQAILGREFRPVGGQYRTQALLTLAASVALRKLPLNLVLVLDCSTSMTGPKLEGTKSAAVGLLDRLDPDDCLSIVTMATDAYTMFGPQVANKASARAVMGRLEATGVTNLDRGLDVAADCLRRAPAGEWVPLIVLLSDGLPTDQDGNQLSDLSPFHAKIADLAAREAVSLATVGLGDAENYDASFLDQLARAGKGGFYYAKDPSELASKFAEEIAKKGSAVANNLAFNFQRTEGVVKRFCKVWPEYMAFDPPHLAAGAGVAHCGPFLANDVQKFYVEFDSMGGAAEERRLLSHIDVQFGGSVQGGLDLFIRDTKDGRGLEVPLQPEVGKAEAAARLGKIMADIGQSNDPKKTKNLAAQAAKLTTVLGMGKATKRLEEAALTGIMSPDANASLIEDTKKTKRLA